MITTIDHFTHYSATLVVVWYCRGFCGCHGTASAVGLEQASRRGLKKYYLNAPDDQDFSVLSFYCVDNYRTTHFKAIVIDVCPQKRADDHAYVYLTVDELA